MKCATLTALLFCLAATAQAQTGIQKDSLQVQVRPAYDKVGKLQRRLFGENYRAEYAAPTLLPVLHLSALHGGLKAERKGGGMQTTSLRLDDPEGREWVLRNLEKNPDPILPEVLRQTFVRDVFDDYMSAQHPFGALVVPPLAAAAKVPHAHPIIGVVAADTALGSFAPSFAGQIALLEEREPLGKSDNTEKMERNLLDDNDNNYDSRTFLRARLLDLLIGDWDRHTDQWRWYREKRDKGEWYTPVPRDRDQALSVVEGIVPHLASRPWIFPMLQGFDGKIRHVKYSLFKSNFMNAWMANQFPHEEWTKITREFTDAITDSVIEQAIAQLPPSVYSIRHGELTAKMKERRDNIPAAMEKFYKFTNRIVDIRATDKKEWFNITGDSTGGLNIVAHKLSKEGKIRDLLMSKRYDPSLTKEIRLYLQDGNDSVVVNNSTSPIRVRMIAGEGNKAYNILNSKKKIHFYKDTAFIPTNLYNVTAPLLALGYNYDDGVMLGAGVRHTHQGFRKLPYASMQQLTVESSLATGAVRIRYYGEWIKAVGKADFTLQGQAFVPNSQNYFGTGNETPFDKVGNYKRYYRARFGLYDIYPALRWGNRKGSSVSIGPSFQYYHFDSTANRGRFIENTDLIHTYDSTSFTKDKWHGGLEIEWIRDKRDNKLLPSTGSYLHVNLQGYAGLNTYSKSYSQLTASFAAYKGIGERSWLVFADRIGGAVTAGNPAFYQSAYLGAPSFRQNLFTGAHGNLLGFRKFRFAGQHVLYNNFEARLKLADLTSYVLPGQLGLVGFFDVGRVWEKDDHSQQWHNGQGGGLYFAPAQMLVLQVVAGHSVEGWYPYVTMGLRF